MILELGGLVAFVVAMVIIDFIDRGISNVFV